MIMEKNFVLWNLGKGNIGLGQEAWWEIFALFRRFQRQQGREIQQLNEVQKETEPVDADSEYRQNSDSTFVWDEKSQLYFHARFSFPPISKHLTDEWMNDYSVCS